MAKSQAWKRRLAVSKMTIKQHRPWPVTVAMIALVIGLGGALALWTYDMGRSLTGFEPRASKEKLQSLQKQLEDLTAERDKLALSANTADSQANMDRATQMQLTDQVKSLTADNQKLKDDLAFFESLMPSATGPDGISVPRLKAEMASPSELHYHLLAMQGGKGSRDFVGEVQLNLTLVQAGKNVMMQFPDPKSGEAGKLKLSFKHYQRVEGLIPLPEGAQVKAVQAKILDHGQVRAQQSINL